MGGLLNKFTHWRFLRRFYQKIELTSMLRTSYVKITSDLIFLLIKGMRHVTSADNKTFSFISLLYTPGFKSRITQKLCYVIYKVFSHDAKFQTVANMGDG